MSPISYGETPARPEWSGDRVRDLYEMELFWECVVQRKPVLGICRGLQLINVALGGSLYQDIVTEAPMPSTCGCGVVRPAPAYRSLIEENSRLAKLYGDQLPTPCQQHPSSGNQATGTGLRGRGGFRQRRHHRSHTHARRMLCDRIPMASRVPWPGAATCSIPVPYWTIFLLLPKSSALINRRCTYYYRLSSGPKLLSNRHDSLPEKRLLAGLIRVLLV